MPGKKPRVQKSLGYALRTLRPLRLPRSIGGWISPPQVAAPKCAAASMIEPVPAKGSSMRVPARAWPMFADTSLRNTLASVRFCTDDQAQAQPRQVWVAYASSASMDVGPR